MKTKTKSLFLTGVLTFAAVTLMAAPQGNGTDILHLSVRKAMTDTGVVGGAEGSVDAKLNKQGNANNQKLTLSFRSLAPDTTYSLYGLLGDDTNLTQVVEFTTDSNGAATLKYQSNGNGNGNGKGKGKGKSKKAGLPAALNPLSNVHELAVLDTNLVAVLTADLTAPDKLQYLIKRNISANDVNASLKIKATTTKAQLDLSASGLVASSDYSLVLNGNVAETHASDAKGKLSIKTELQNAMDILDLRTVELWDGATNSVVGTTLP